MNQNYIKKFYEETKNKDNEILKVIIIKYKTDYSSGEMIIDYQIYSKFIKDFTKVLKDTEILSIEETYRTLKRKEYGEIYYV